MLREDASEIRRGRLVVAALLAGAAGPNVAAFGLDDEDELDLREGAEESLEPTRFLEVRRESVSMSSSSHGLSPFNRHKGPERTSS